MKDTAFLNEGVTVCCLKCGCNTNTVQDVYCHNCGSKFEYKEDIFVLIQSCPFVCNKKWSIGVPEVEDGLCQGYSFSETNDETHDICKYCRIYFGKDN